MKPLEAWETQGHVFTMEDGRALDPAYVTGCSRDQGREPLPELTFHGLGIAGPAS